MSKHAKGEAPIKEQPYFSQLDPDEHHECRDYLFSREIVLRERMIKPHLQQHIDDDVQGLTPSGEFTPIIHSPRPENQLETRVTMIRKAWCLSGEFTTQVRENPVWLKDPAARLVVLWPEWPEKPYFEIPLDERLRRIEAFSTLLNEKDRLVALANLINPENPGTAKKAVEKIAILADAPLQLQMEAVKAIFMIRAPELFKGAKAPQAKQGGRGSEKARVLDDLYAFAAHDLCRVEKLPGDRVIKLICHPKGHKDTGEQVYSSVRKLYGPLGRLSKRLQKFLGDLMGNLVPLEPFKLSQPDFTHLEEAMAANPEPWEGSLTDSERLERFLKHLRHRQK
jgi:hypothetical protein